MAVKSKEILRKDKISNVWWRRFVERQPEVSLQRADSTAHIRMDSVNKESISRQQWLSSPIQRRIGNTQLSPYRENI